MSAVDYLFKDDGHLYDKLQMETDDGNGIVCQDTLIEILDGYSKYFFENVLSVDLNEKYPEKSIGYNQRLRKEGAADLLSHQKRLLK